MARVAVCVRPRVCLLPPVTFLRAERAAEARGRASAAQPTASACWPMFWTFLVNEKAQKGLTLLLHYLCCFSKGSDFPSASCPGPSQVSTEYTKRTALSGMIYGPLAGGPSVSKRPHSSGQVLLGSWPWEGHRRSDKDDVESISDPSTGQTPCDGALLEELVRFVTRSGRGHCWLRSQGHFSSVPTALWVTGMAHSPC